MAKLDNYTLRLRSKEYRPIVIGGMGVDISTAELALEAVRLGGVGHISDAMAPFVSDKRYGTRFQNTKQRNFKEFRNNPDKSQVKWDPQMVYEASLNHVGTTMNAKKGSGLLFINVMEKLTMGSPRETLKARLRGAMDGGIDGITLSAGLHLCSLSLVEKEPRFRDVLFGIIVSSVRALKVFLRTCQKVNRLPDYIVVEGPLAGGHLGFGLDWKDYDLNTIVREIFELLRSEDLHIPVIPAGGIFTGADAVHFLDAGASAVQVATRFTISRECGLPTEAKQAYILACEEDVEVNMSSPAGYPMRMLHNSPSLNSNVKPNCEALGYLLDKDGQCSYHQAYEKTPCDEQGNKLPVSEKMCICYHFMRCQCYTCGHYVYRLKETTIQLPDGNYYLPPAEHIFNDYLQSEDGTVRLPEPSTELQRKERRADDALTVQTEQSLSIR